MHIVPWNSLPSRLARHLEMPSAINRKFGAHVRALRGSRGLTQEALAESSGLSVDSIRRIERGTFSPTLDSLDKLATGFDLSLASLFAPLDAERPAALGELTSFLASKPDREIRTAYRVLRAMFENGKAKPL